jgi:hypothetical protein
MMALNLEQALSELAHTVPVGDDSFPADGMTATVRRIATHVRRRRAAKHAGTSIVGVAAVAAVAIGGSAIKSHVDAARGPSTTLSKRAGAVCGQPFDASGKSDPRFSVPVPMFQFQIGNPDITIRMVSIWNEVVELSEPSVKLSPSHPATAVFLRDGIVVGIGDALTDWEVMNPTATASPGDDTSPGLRMPVSEMMNCTGTLPAKITNNMFELVILAEYRVDGDSRTALVIAPPVKGPFVDEPNNYTPPPGGTQTPDLNDSWANFGVGETAQVRGDQVEFRIGDYLAVMGAPGANVPLYYASTDGSFANGSKPYAGPAEAHITDTGSIVATYNGAKVSEWTKTDLIPPG